MENNNSATALTYRKFAPILVGIAIVGIAYFYAAAQQNNFPSPSPMPSAVSRYAQINLNLSEITSAFPALQGYSTVKSGALTPMSSALQQSGYMYASVSEFDWQNASVNGIYPKTIASSVFILNSTASAAQAFQGQLSLASLQSGTGHTNTTVSHSVYSYMGHSVAIYRISTIDVPSAADIAPNNGLPIYQSSGLFYYGNFTALITLNGYQSMDGNMSTMIAQELFRHMVGAG